MTTLSLLMVLWARVVTYHKLSHNVAHKNNYTKPLFIELWGLVVFYKSLVLALTLHWTSGFLNNVTQIFISIRMHITFMNHNYTTIVTELLAFVVLRIQFFSYKFAMDGQI